VLFKSSPSASAGCKEFSATRAVRFFIPSPSGTINRCGPRIPKHLNPHVSMSLTGSGCWTSAAEPNAKSEQRVLKSQEACYRPRHCKVRG
jgi:hypothetical protein